MLRDKTQFFRLELFRIYEQQKHKYGLSEKCQEVQMTKINLLCNGKTLGLF